MAERLSDPVCRAADGALMQPFPARGSHRTWRPDSCHANTALPVFGPLP